MTTTTTKLHTWLINITADIEGVTDIDNYFAECLQVTTDKTLEQVAEAVKDISEAINEREPSHITFQAFADDEDDALTEPGVTLPDNGQELETQPEFFKRDVEILQGMLKLRLGL